MLASDCAAERESFRDDGVKREMNASHLGGIAFVG